MIGMVGIEHGVAVISRISFCTIITLLVASIVESPNISVEPHVYSSAALSLCRSGSILMR